jgi:hypothetical protein
MLLIGLLRRGHVEAGREALSHHRRRRPLRSKEEFGHVRGIGRDGAGRPARDSSAPLRMGIRRGETALLPGPAGGRGTSSAYPTRQPARSRRLRSLLPFGCSSTPQSPDAVLSMMQAPPSTLSAHARPCQDRTGVESCDAAVRASRRQFRLCRAGLAQTVSS